MSAPSIAIALSGGVDSAVAAAVLCRCVHTAADVAALRCFGGPHTPPPRLSEVLNAIDAAVPIQSWSRNAGARLPSPDVPVSYFPFYMRNWHDDDDEGVVSGWCVRAQEDYEDAQRVAQALGLIKRDTALPVFDFSPEYADACFQRMLDAYAAGHTLNIDVLCNSTIKFGAAMRKLLDNSAGAKATLLATGHYARIWCPPSGTPDDALPSALLLQPCSAGHDLNDQSIFLSQVPPSALAKAIFPLGHLFTSKADVRAVARHVLRGLSTAEGQESVAYIAEKATSTGICFVGPPRSTSRTRGAPAAAFRAAALPCGGTPSSRLHFASFLNRYLPPPASNAAAGALLSRTVFRDAVSGKVLAVPGEPYPPAAPSPFAALREDYPALLPAFAVTIGQRLPLYCREDEKGAKLISFYVSEKILVPPSRTSSQRVRYPADQVPTRLLQEVRVVAQWNHPLLFSREATAHSVCWWLPDRVLRRGTVADGIDGVYRLRCWCCTRHQEALRPATVEWAAAEVEKGDCDSGIVRVKCVRVLFDVPVRAITPGQALVMYIPLSEVAGWMEARDTSAGSAMAVIGCGWISQATNTS